MNSQTAMYTRAVLNTRLLHGAFRAQNDPWSAVAELPCHAFKDLSVSISITHGLPYRQLSSGGPEGTLDQTCMVNHGRANAAVKASLPSTRWEHFPHQADVGVRGFGVTKAEAFVQAAMAMTAVIVDLGLIRASERVTVTCSAPDDELLFVDWLNAVVFEMATRNLLFSRFEVQIEGGELRGSMWGEPVDIDRHEPAVEIKGATFTELRVRPVESGGWLAQCVVDV